MARIRTIKPEFWKHEALSSLPEATHLLAAALLNYSDDYGYFNANTKLIQAELSPLREPSVSIHESLGSLHECRYIRLGTGPDGRRYGQIVEFSTHQRVAHPTPSKISEITIAWDEFGNPPENIVNPPETFRPEGKGRERKGREGKGREGKGTGNREGNTTASPRPEKSPEMEHFKSIYPKRAGSNPWGRAERAIHGRLSEGHSWEDLCEGARRYAAFIQATGKLGTEYVMQAATFCGPDKPFLEPWVLPATKAEIRQNQNIDAGKNWLAMEHDNASK